MSVIEPRTIARRREPMFNAPLVVLGLIVILIAIQAAFSWAPDAVQDGVVRDFAFIPGRLTISIWPRRLIELLDRANSDPAALQQARAIRELRVLGGGPKPWTLLTYAFLHGSWTHVLLNSVWLVAFGPPIARRFGSARFLLFMAVTAIFSALAHWASASMDFSPLIGASGADSGLMGAATRFMFQPGAPLGPFAPLGQPEIESIPAASLRGVLRRPAGDDLPRHLARDELHLRRGRADIRLLGHAGRLGRPSRRLFFRAPAVSAVRPPIPRPADGRRVCDGAADDGPLNWRRGRPLLPSARLEDEPLTGKLPTEIQSLIENHINGFNDQNTRLFLSVFGDCAIIVDGIAPYRWLNPNAAANWLADVAKWRENLGVSYERLSYEMGFWNVEGSHAYAVVSGSLTVTIKGQTVVRTGTLAYTFSKHGAEWKIEAQAWGRTS